MTALFNRWLPGLTLLVWSGVLLAFYFTGRLGSFVVPAFRLNVLLAGLAMLAMACCFLFLPAVASCCDDARCGHPLGRRKSGRILTFLILLLPIITAAMFSPASFSASTFRNRVVTTDAGSLVKRTASSALAQAPAAAPSNPAEPPLPVKDGSPPAPAAPAQDATAENSLPRSKDGNIQVQVIDLLYAAQDPTMRADFEGKTIESIGQVMADESHNPGGNRFKLMRMFMYCCAADAKPIAALVESPQKPGAADMAWVRVVGKVEFKIEGGRTIPIIAASRIEQTDPPEETMLY